MGLPVPTSTPKTTMASGPNCFREKLIYLVPDGVGLELCAGCARGSVGKQRTCGGTRAGYKQPDDIHGNPQRGELPIDGLQFARRSGRCDQWRANWDLYRAAGSLEAL